MVILLKIKRRDFSSTRQPSYFGVTHCKNSEVQIAFFLEVKHATRMETCTKIYFLFIRKTSLFWLYNLMTSLWNPSIESFGVCSHINCAVTILDPGTRCFLNWDSAVLDWDSWFSTRWVPELTITICNKIAERISYTVHYMHVNVMTVISQFALSPSLRYSWIRAC